MQNSLLARSLVYGGALGALVPTLRALSKLVEHTKETVVRKEKTREK
jgi:hypothetical protein